MTLLSRIVSYLLHPLAIPTYGALTLMFLSDQMAGIDTMIKLYFVSIVVLGTALFPLAAITMMRAFALIPDYSLSGQNDRRLPMLLMIVCYIACLFMLREVPVTFLLRKFILAALACVVAALVTNSFWKISLHMIAFGGYTALVLVTTFAGMSHSLPLVVATFVLGGALASARLYLGQHNPAQIGVGYLTGILLTGIVLVFS